MTVTKITRKQLYVAAVQIDQNSSTPPGGTQRTYHAGWNDDLVAQMVGASVPQIRRLRIDIFGQFAVEKKPTTKEKLAALEDEVAQLRIIAARAPNVGDIIVGSQLANGGVGVTGAENASQTAALGAQGE